LPAEARGTGRRPTAEILTIGSEILLGEIQDTNAGHIARALREAGLEVCRKTSIGDEVQAIAAAVREAAARCDVLLTTGGLGPTVDDPTRAALAAAADVELAYRPELWDEVRAMFARFDREPTENNRRQAWLPESATAISNPVGTAPAFALEIEGALVIALPGVPREMEHLLLHEALPRLRTFLGLRDAFAIRILRTAGVGESQIDAEIGDLEESENPRVGLAAHMGTVDVRITARGATATEAEGRIAEMEAELRRRLGDWIYGADEDTLAGVALGAIAARGWRVALAEAGLGGRAVRTFSEGGAVFAGATVWTEPMGLEALADAVATLRVERDIEVGLGVSLEPEIVPPADRGAESSGSSAPFPTSTSTSTSTFDLAASEGRRPPLRIHVVLETPEGARSQTLKHGGHPRLAPRRAVAALLDLARRPPT
jgi:competence/damage-inducible protein CinA-like protein